MDKKNSDGEDNGDYFNPEEEVAIEGDKAPKFQGEKVESGEENEELIFKMRGRIYRFRDGEWKERGTGDIKFLRQKEKKTIRFLLRQDKTLKPVANFMITSNPSFLCNLEPHQGSEKMFMFAAFDCSEDAPVVEKFVIKLGNADSAKKFKEAFEKAKKSNQSVKEGKAPEEFEVIEEEKKEEKKD